MNAKEKCGLFVNHQELKIKVFQRPGVRKEYESLEPEFKILREILSARQNAGLAVGVWKNQAQIRKLWQEEKTFSAKRSRDEANQKMKSWSRAVERAKGWIVP